MQWQNFLDALCRKLRTAKFSTLKIKLKSETELLSSLLADEELVNLVSLWLGEQFNKRDIKCVSKALSYKVLGNKEFQLKNYNASLISYTKSALYAPSGSEELPVAIANRSAALFFLENYTECLKDIELAIQLDYPEKLRHKLYLRAVQCYSRLGKKKQAKEALFKLREMLRNSDDISNMKKEEIEKQITRLSTSVLCTGDDKCNSTNIDLSVSPILSFGENPDFPFASTAVEKKYTPQKGRHVVATRDLKMGETLFVEKPFAFVLLDHDNFNNACENCCTTYNNTPIPCKMCPNTLFCNDGCRDASCLSYHHWECPGSQMGLWHQIGMAHLAIRILLTSTTSNTRFNDMQQLISNFEDVPISDLIAYGITSVMLTLYLSKYTDFFKVNNLTDCLVSKFSDTTANCNFITEDDKRLYVSSLLLKHLLQIISNGHAITKINTILSDNDKLCIEQQDRIATAIYPSASMMNHSCDPNVINSFKNQYLVVKTLKNISAGEEVLICYGPYFRRMSREERQDTLQNQYFFTCKCEACTLPEYQNFRERFNAMKCPECNGAVYTLDNCYSMHCLDCGITPSVNYEFEVKRGQAAFDEAQVYLEVEREEEALTKLKECLSIRRETLYKYHEDLTTTLDVIGKVYALMGRWLDSITYLEHSIVAIEERYGPSSIEYANEIVKLTDICFRYLQEEPNTTTKWYKNILKKTRRYLDRVQQIVDCNYGPWYPACHDVIEKKKILSSILKNFNI